MPFRRIWTQDEDKTLKYLRQDLNIQRWSLIAEKLQIQFGIFGRNQKQCRQRYHNHLDSSLNLQKLSSCEQKQLFQLHNRFGNRWAEIAKYFQGRTDASLKNIFHSKLRKGIRKLNRYVKEKANKLFRTYPLNVVCKIMDKSEVKLKNQFDKICLNQQFFKELQNGLIEYSGSVVPSSQFEGWNQKKVCQYLIRMLNKIQELQNCDQRIQITSINDQSQYVPLIQKKNTYERKVKLRIYDNQTKIFIKNQKQSDASVQQEVYNLERIQLNQEIKEVLLKRKGSFETQYTQSQLLQNKHKKYSFEINVVNSLDAQNNQNVRDLLKQINFDYELKQFQSYSESSQIQFCDFGNIQNINSQQLFQRMICDDMQEPIVF